MSFLIGKMKETLAGHKDLTDSSPVKELYDIEKVYIPLVNCGSTTCDVHVKVGDKVKVGTLLAARNDWAEVPMFSSVSGEVVDIAPLVHSQGKDIAHIVIKNDFNYDKEAELATIDLKNATREELIEFTKDKGIVGCGGAGFPTYIKYKDVENIETLLINAVECEPYITADYRFIEEHLDDLINGVLMMLKMSDAKNAKIAIKEDKKKLIEQINQAITDDRISVVTVPDAYPMGWERTLIREVEGKEYDRLPAEIGLIVNNSATAINLAYAARTGLPIVERLVTISGDAIDQPTNVRVPVGTQASAIIERIGGYNTDDVLIIAGGPMMGPTMESDEFSLCAYNNAVTVLKTTDIETVSCLRCGACSDACPAGLQPVRIQQMVVARDYEALARLNANSCVECGLCTYVCPSNISVAQGVRVAKKILAAQSKK